MDANRPPYAMQEAESKGRRYPEADHPYRGKFQRDRDRILHAAAFRRLTAKTQVLVSGTNDHHRTRLTHTLEVAQVSRTIARQLRLHEDLTEAIALAHDLGHPPFGHAGEDALNKCMKEHGGFEHNRHGLRIVEFLEQRYPEFPGLNLTWEVRESLAFHSKTPQAEEIQPYRAGIGQPTLEAQVVDAADSLVYDLHDLDDAFGVGLVQMEQVRKLQCWQLAEAEVHRLHGNFSAPRLLPTVLRWLMSQRESDLLQQTLKNLEKYQVDSVAKLKAIPETLVHHSAAIQKLVDELRQFLYAEVYHHHRVLRMAHRGRQQIHDLFQSYVAMPGLMPELHHQRTKEVGTPQAVCDYLAGMTDRLATQEHRDLFQGRDKA